MRDDEETRRAVSRLTPARVGLMADEAARAYGIDPVVARRALLTAQALITIPVRALPDGDDLASGIVGAFSRCPCSMRCRRVRDGLWWATCSGGPGSRPILEIGRPSPYFRQEIITRS